MSVRTIEFDAFGLRYKTIEFTAIPAFTLMGKKSELHPVEMLRQTEVRDLKNKWHSLSVAENINDYVFDAAGVLVPRMVLNGILSLVNELNFAFMNGWQGVKVPKRFYDASQTASSKHVDPVISQLLQDGVATWRELEEYYSLHDALKMFDVIMVKGLNAAMSQEAATRSSGRR